MTKTKQTFLKYKNGKFEFMKTGKLDKFKDAGYYKQDPAKSGILESEFVVSFTKEKEGLGIFLWADNFSVGFTRDELMKLFELIKDEEKLKTMLVTQNI